MSPISPKTVGELLAELGSRRAQLDADLLLARVLGCTRAALRGFPERPVSELQQRQWQELLSRRADGEPYAYLTGEQEFWSMSLAVGPGVLVPRADSELLVEAALARLDAEQPGWVVDVGTGSANLALALANERPQLRVLAIDSSAAALAWARRNVAALGHARVQLVRAQGLASVADASLCAVLSNPPYIAADDPDLDPAARRFEPEAALIAGDEGLAMLKRLAIESRRVLQRGGWILLEHGWKQGPAVLELLAELGYSDCQTLNDLAQRPRVTVGRLG